MRKTVFSSILQTRQKKILISVIKELQYSLLCVANRLFNNCVNETYIFIWNKEVAHIIQIFSVYFVQSWGWNSSSSIILYRRNGIRDFIPTVKNRRCYYIHLPTITNNICTVAELYCCTAHVAQVYHVEKLEMYVIFCTE